MAFGSWIKNLVKKGVDFVKTKALPAIKKGLDIATKAAPVIGGIVGGPAGAAIGTAVSTANDIFNKVSSVIPNSVIPNFVIPQTNNLPRLGANGGGTRFIPMLK